MSVCVSVSGRRRSAGGLFGLEGSRHSLERHSEEYMHIYIYVHYIHACIICACIYYIFYIAKYFIERHILVSMRLSGSLSVSPSSLCVPRDAQLAIYILYIQHT